MLLDAGSPFLELSQFAAHGMYNGEVPAAGIITGIGRVSGQECLIIANDATVKGGSYYPMTVKKHLRAQDIAENICRASIWLTPAAQICPARTRCSDRDHFWPDLLQPGQPLRRGHPQIAVVMGSCTAGGAYVPAMSDERSSYAARGPYSRRSATGQGGYRRGGQRRGSGGAEVHSRISGVTDHYAMNDSHALGLARRAVAI